MQKHKVIIYRCIFNVKEYPYKKEKCDFSFSITDNMLMRFPKNAVLETAQTNLRCNVAASTNLLPAAKALTLGFCERAVKRCVNVGKNSKKYTGKLLDKSELVY